MKAYFSSRHIIIALVFSLIGMLIEYALCVSFIERTKQAEVLNGAYQIYLNQDSITIRDGERYVGAMRWDNTCKLDSLLLDDNQ